VTPTLPARPHRPDRRLTLIAFAAGALALEQAMVLWIRRDGTPFLPWLAAAVVLVGLGIVGSGRLEARLPIGDLDRVLVAVIAAGIAWSTVTILVSPGALPVPAQDGAVMRWTDARLLVVLAGIVGISGLAERPVLGRLHLPVLLGLVLALGVWLIGTSTWPPIDVFFFERDAGIRLGQLLDPYAGTITNIYGSTAYYGDAFATVDRVLIGYPYPPVSLLVTSAGQLLGDEPRTGLLLAIVAAGGLVGAMRRDPVGRGAAALLLLSPALPFILHDAFVEPVAIVLLAATVAAARRSPRLTAIFLGLFLFAKQTCLLAIPLIPLLIRQGAPRREVVRMAAIAAVAALLVAVPFLLWDPAAFMRATISFHLGSPFRPDSLGFGPPIAERLGTVPVWVMGGATLSAIALVLWRAPWTPSGFAAGTGFVLLVLASFAKQAFPDYHMLVVGALCIAIAAARSDEARSAEAEADAATDRPPEVPDLAGAFVTAEGTGTTGPARAAAVGAAAVEARSAEPASSRAEARSTAEEAAS
jgi:hypothetical protein